MEIVSLQGQVRTRLSRGENGAMDESNCQAEVHGYPPQSLNLTDILAVSGRLGWKYEREKHVFVRL